MPAWDMFMSYYCHLVAIWLSHRNILKMEGNLLNGNTENLQLKSDSKHDS